MFGVLCNKLCDNFVDFGGICTSQLITRLTGFVEGYVFSNGQKFQRKLLKRGEVLPEEKCKL